MRRGRRLVSQCHGNWHCSSALGPGLGHRGGSRNSRPRPANPPASAIDLSVRSAERRIAAGRRARGVRLRPRGPPGQRAGSHPLVAGRDHPPNPAVFSVTLEQDQRPAGWSVGTGGMVRRPHRSCWLRAPGTRNRDVRGCGRSCDPVKILWNPASGQDRVSESSGRGCLEGGKDRDAVRTTSSQVQCDVPDRLADVLVHVRGASPLRLFPRIGSNVGAAAAHLPTTPSRRGRRRAGITRSPFVSMAHADLVKPREVYPNLTPGDAAGPC
jgi:hypothetical protein